MISSRAALIRRRRAVCALLLRQKSTSAVLSTTTTSTESSSSSSAATAAVTPPPTREQLKRVFSHAAVPMIGFGLMDQTIMLQAGNAIDCTLGVTFGLSTLAAAAFGQVCSDASGVLFGGTLESLAAGAGLPRAELTAEQRGLTLVKNVRLAGNFFGVILGCCLGLLNLLFIDTARSSTLKLQAFNEEQEFEFTIEASNAERKDATTLKVKGPDVDGLLASMTAALAVRGCSLVEIHARRSADDSELLDADEKKMIDDTFYVVKRDTGRQFPDDELEELAKGLLDSTRTPMNVNTVKAAMHELESTNSYLRARVEKLEQVVYQRQITVVPSGPAYDESQEEERGGL